jgi:hypothetical protein
MVGCSVGVAAMTGFIIEVSVVAKSAIAVDGWSGTTG